MGVMLDLTVSGAEILDSVVFMDKSPAYAAFKEEIEKILSDFNKTKRFGEATEIDIKTLVESSGETILNMHRAFLVWIFNDDDPKAPIADSKYYTYLKLFFKGQEKQLTSINGGKKLISPADVTAFKQKYIAAISSTPELYNSLKEFFSGYVYGYFFNYLTEQAVMRDYAEFLVCLGIMSGKVSTSENNKQKILPKMAVLLNNDRFKYISGEVPIEVMLNIVNSRFDKKDLSPEENAAFTAALKEYIVKNYQYQAADGLVIDDVTCTIMTKLSSEYISAVDFAADMHKNTFAGTRSFLDGDKNDMRSFTAERVGQIVSDKCRENFDDYFRAGREARIDVGISSEVKGYKYPLTYLDGKTFWFTELFKVLLFPACDKSIYVEVDENDLPLKLFPFASGALKTNIIRILGGIESKGYSIRADKRDVLVEINAFPQLKNLSEDDKKMMALEKLMYAISGNMDAVSYQKLLHEYVFGAKLYEEYIRYRMDRVFAKGMESLDAKKFLLDELNKLK